MNIAKSGVTFAGIGLLFWLLWAWVSGSGVSALGATSEEWAEMLKTVWTATLLVTPAGTLALGAVNISRGKTFVAGTST